MVWEVDFIRWVQSFSNPVLDNLFQLITMLGEAVLVVAVVAWIYWNQDKQIGIRLTFAIVASVVLNGMVKDIFRLPRPIGMEGITSGRLETATGYSFPSGHSQNGATLFASLALHFKWRWLLWAAIAIIPLIGLSRLYLGVHYPKDVLVGILLGIAAALVAYYLTRKFSNILRLMLVTMFALLPGLFWIESADSFKAYGLMLGVTLGTWVEQRFAKFQVPKRLGAKLFRWLGGCVVLGLVMAGLKLLLPDGMLFAMLRYGAVTFTALGVYPVLFTRAEKWLAACRLKK